MPFALVGVRGVFPEEVDFTWSEVTSGDELVPAGLSRGPSSFAEETKSSLRGLSEPEGALSVALSRTLVLSSEEIDVNMERCFSSVTEAISPGVSRMGDCSALEVCWLACVRSFLVVVPVP